MTPSVVWAGAVRGSSPASLARNEFTPSQAITTLARMSPSGRSVRTPAIRSEESRSKPVATVEVTSRAPAVDRLSGQPGVEIGAVGSHPVVGRVVPGAGAVVDGQRLGRRHQHGGPAGHPALYRHLSPPLRHDLVEDPAVHHAAVDVFRAGKGPALHQDHIPAGPGQLKRRRRARGTGADHDRVDGHDVIRHGSPPSAGPPVPARPGEPRTRPAAPPARRAPPGRRRRSRDRPSGSSGRTGRY